MINKKYFKEFLKKTKWWEHLILITLFIVSLVINYWTITKNIFINTLMFLGTILTFLSIWNRIHRFKQDYIFSLLCNVTIAASVLVDMQFTKDIVEKTNQLILFMQYGLIYSIFTLCGFFKIMNNKNNIIKAQNKFLSKELIISIFIFTISLVFLIFLTKSFIKIDYKMIILLISIAFASSAIATLFLFRWNFTFILWQFSNILALTYFVILGIWPFALLSIVFTITDGLSFIDWIIDGKKDKKKKLLNKS